jgi:uncharacterized protein (DUF2267 family)
MKADQFIKEVMNRAGLSTRQQAIDATHATLAVLGERLFGGEKEDLAAQLPPELQVYLLEADVSRRFDLEEFFERIGEEEGVGVDEASKHAKAVVSVLCDSVTPGEIMDVRSQLSKDYDVLFNGRQRPQ